MMKISGLIDLDIGCQNLKTGLISQGICLLTQGLAPCPWYEGHGDVIDVSFHE